MPKNNVAQQQNPPMGQTDRPFKLVKAVTPRLSVTLPSSTYAELESIAVNDEISMGEAARRAIKRQLFLEEVLRNHAGQLMVKGEDGNYYYIVFDD